MEGIFLITGATGFIGACLTRELIRQNKQVNILVRDKKLNWRLKDVASKLKIYECDLLDNSLENIIDKIQPDYIFHLASNGSLPSENNITQMIDVNIRGTINLINATKKHKFKLFINTGTSSEYGIKEAPMRESDLSNPINTYGVTKLASTLLCQQLAQRENLPIITLRLFSPYGYFEERSRFIPSVILHALENKRIDVSSRLYVRDFIFIDDVIDAYKKAISSLHEPGTIINIGSGRQHTIEAVVNAIIRITKSSSEIRFDKVPKQDRQIEPKIWQADITAARKLIGWQPKYSLDGGLRKTIAWFKKYKRLYV